MSKLTDKQELDKLYTLAEVAELFKVTTATVREWIKKDKLKAIKVSERAIRITETELVKLLADNLKTEEEGADQNVNSSK